MSFSLDHILNGNLSTVVNYINEGPIIENFYLGNMGIKNNTKTLTETQIKNLSETNKDIDQSMVVENCTKLLKSIINNVVSRNQSSLLQALAASNTIIFAGATFEGDFTMKGIKQNNEITVDGAIDLVQKIQNDITTEITEEITKNLTKQTISAATTATSTDIGQTLGKAMDGIKEIGTSFMDNAGKVLDGALTATAGNKVSTTTKTNTENILKETFNLDDSFKITSNDEFNSAVSNQLSSENLSSCAQEANAKNNFDFSSVTFKGNVEITDIEQTNIVKSALDCAFNQDILNKLSAIFVTNYENIIKNMTDKTTTNNEGDILAAGVAGATLVAAGGEAISTASQGIGSGVSEGVQGIGSGIGNTIGSIGSALAMNPIFIISCCVVLIILMAGAFFYFKSSRGGVSSDSSDDFSLA
jgi:hypothetical protein